MIYVFYSNDPLSNDQGGGVEHFRGIYRALKESNLEYRLIASRMSNHTAEDIAVSYISCGSNFLRYYLSLWRWFFRNKNKFTGTDVFHFHRNYAAWPKYLLASRAGKTIITYHGMTGYVIREKLGMLASPVRSIMKSLERQSLKRADQIIFVSERDRQDMCKTLLGDNFNKSVIIPAAFDETIFSGFNQPPLELQGKVLILGRISNIKNIPLAIDAITEVCRRGNIMQLTIAGDGEERYAVAQYAHQSEYAKNIKLIGKVEHEEIPDLMMAHGIVLLTSRSEASPTVVKEAIAACRPVVTTDVGDVGLWVRNDINGFICDASAESLADGLEKANALIQRQCYDQAIGLDELSEKNIMSKVLQCYSATCNDS